MSAANYYGFLCGLGSLLVATLGTPVWVAPRFFGFGKRMVGWLMAAVTVRAVAEAPDLMLSDAGAAPLVYELQRIGVLVSMVVFAEAARSSAYVTGRRAWSAWWHLPLAAAWLFHGAVLVSPEAAQWAGLPGRVSWLVPAGLGLYSIIGLGRALKRTRVPPRRLALKVAVLGFALANFLTLESAPGARDGLTTVLIWMTVVGLSALVLTLPEFRRRVALGMVFALAAVPFLGPLLCELNVRWVEKKFESRALLMADSGRNLGKFSFDVGNSPADSPAAAAGRPAAETILVEQVRRLRQRDPSLRDAYHWSLLHGHVWRYAATGNTLTLVPFRRAHEEEIRQWEKQGGAFFFKALDDENGGFVAAETPVRVAEPGQVAVWFAVEYPASLWTLQIDNARRNAASMVALFAVFVAAGLILGSAQALENAGQTRVYRAVAADRAKREFLAFLSHELRTPLQSVLGRAELLQRAPLTANEQSQVSAILEDGRLLLRLVTDLLDLGAIEAGRLQLRPAACALRGTLQALTESYRARADAKGLTLTLEIDPEVPEVVEADEGRLRQMLGNFLSNALKYTERGGVGLTVRRANGPGRPAVDGGDGLNEDGDAREPAPAGGGGPGKEALNAATHCSLEFVVSDTGPGVPPAQIDRLFSLFTRVDAGNVLRREGTGVGLALVRRLCTLMGGKVWAANRPEGGAEFTLQLDLRLAAKEDLRAVAEAARAAAPAYGGHALVVEDNPNARAWLEDALKVLGFSVQAVGEGDAAMQAVTRGGVDLVLLDINLPGRNGMAVARELRAAQPDLRIIGCSAEAFAATREAALAAGMDSYLTKPVSLAALENAVGRPAAKSGDVFARLQSKDTTAEARARLAEDWPRMRGETETALGAGDHEALRRLGHFLKSTALLINDDQLADLCRRLSSASVAQQTDEGRELLGEVDRLIADWPTEPKV